LKFNDPILPASVYLQCTEAPGKEGASAYFDLFSLRLKNGDKSPLKTAIWPRLPAAAAAMTSAFAVNNFAVSHWNLL
jgi:hypothetical protein